MEVTELIGGDWINRRWRRKRTWKPRRGLGAWIPLFVGSLIAQIELFVPFHFDRRRPRQGRMRLRCLVGALSVTILTPQRLTRISCMTLYDMIRWARVKGRWRGFFCFFGVKGMGLAHIKAPSSRTLWKWNERFLFSLGVWCPVLFLILT